MELHSVGFNAKFTILKDGPPTRTVMRLRQPGALFIALATAISQANAAPINWSSWSDNSAGSILTTGGPVGVTYLGEMNGLTSNYPSWTPTTTWTDSSAVSNSPSQIGAMIRLHGGGGAAAVTDTLTFSAPVLNPAVAIWSLGASGAQASFDFNGASPVLIAGGLLTSMAVARVP